MTFANYCKLCEDGAERALLSVFTVQERETLIGLLRRMHENLPAVEVATERYLAQHHPEARRSSTLPLVR